MTTYSDLVTNIPIILISTNRALVDNMDLIISQAVDLIFGVIDHDLYRVTLPAVTVTGAAPTIDLKAEDPKVFELRALKLIRPGYTTPVPLRRRDIDFLEMMFTRDVPGAPRYYAEVGDFLTYTVFPVPDVDYDVTPEVNQRPIPLGDGTGGTSETNVLTDWIPRTLEKACLYQASLFMKNPMDIEKYKGEFNEAVLQDNAQISRRKRDNTGVRPVDTTNTGV